MISLILVEYHITTFPLSENVLACSLLVLAGISALSISIREIRRSALGAFGHSALGDSAIGAGGSTEETKYSHIKGLRSHYLTEHKVGIAREFVCDVCSKSFVTKNALKYHIKISHLGVQPTKTKFKCPECPEEEFHDEKTLIVHKIRYHGGDPFKCQFCGKTFDSWHTFARHEKEHEGTRKVFTCDIEGCGKTFNSKKSLEYHKKSVEHVGQTNAFVCGQCGNGFNHLSALKEHEKVVHSSERKFVCEECGESFKRTEVLKKHRMIHTGEKPFQCDICQQRFRHKEVLRRHVEGHQKKGTAFRPNGPMKNVRKRVNPK